MKKYPLAEEECVEMGGHCWDDRDPLLVIAVVSPPHVRRCRHCGREEIGRVREPIVWSKRKRPGKEA